MHVFEDRFFFFLNSVIKTNTINFNHAWKIFTTSEKYRKYVLIILYIILYIGRLFLMLWTKDSYKNYLEDIS